MNREWKLRRELQERHDGRQRWDHAFQQLLQWAGSDVVGSDFPPTPAAHPSREANDENRDLYESLDLAPSSGAVH